MSAEATPPPVKPGAGKGESRARAKSDATPKAAFTDRQGQFLAVLHLYRRLHRRSPAEGDLCRFFDVTPPTVHNTIIKLEELGLITREPGVARSVRVTVPVDQIPPLAETTGPPW
ncbi:MAG TPA: helix-turn-helix domain-containing protein [Urbifossiella sp.]|jgi:DNA-binding MarR family transcriptional regulator|nr:helix-turn-helix domain-containing protein [Urbifossiella sp.]